MSAGTVAIIGASADPAKFGCRAVRAYLRRGWEVFPVNPRGGLIAGRPVYASVRDVPVPLDRVLLYLPPDRGARVLPDIAAVAPREFYVNPGAESPALVAEARRLGLEPILACALVAIGADADD